MLRGRLARLVNRPRALRGLLRVPVRVPVRVLAAFFAKRPRALRVIPVIVLQCIAIFLKGSEQDLVIIYS